MPISQKILIVDDVSVNILMLKNILQKNYTLATASSGEEALRMVSEFRPDLILLDVMMPGIDGYEVCRRIREEKRYRFIKIIMVSAKTMIDDRLKGYRVGADDYITKPFDRKELEAKVRVFSKLKHEEELNQLKENLLILFSHETKTPLSVIIGLAEILQSMLTLKDEIKKHIGTILQQSYQLLDFINKTSLICSLKSGIEMSRTSGSVTNHLNSAIEALKEYSSQKNVTLKLDVKESIELFADWTLLGKALGYVLNNAIKYSPEGGTVLAQAKLSDGLCEISVSDQGEGIKADWFDKVFDEFAVQNLIHHQKGQGLSLAISRYIMELHDGTILVESTPGNGATFILRIPISLSQNGCETHHFS